MTEQILAGSQQERNKLCCSATQCTVLIETIVSATSCLLLLSQHVVCVQKRRSEVAAAADERVARVKAAHQAKLARAEDLAAIAQQRKVEQAAQLRERSKLLAIRNEEVHHKRSAAATTCIMQLVCCNLFA